MLQQWRDLARSGASIEIMVRERLLWTLQDETLEQTDLIDQMVRFFTRDGAPMTEDVFARQEAALQSELGLDAEAFDKAWVAWVLKNYPKR